MRPLVWLLVCAGVLVATGCGDDDGTMMMPADGAMPSPMSCGSTAAMDVGRCVLDAGGECRGAVGETFSFSGLSAGDPMSMVVGPQGSTMIVFMVRATGIDPGDAATESTQPFVEVSLFDGATQLTVFRQRTAFTGTGPFVSRQLWVVVDALASALAGHTVTAVARLTDRNGEARCGIVNVVPQT